MNAALRKNDLTEGAHVPVNETDALAIQVAELRADVRHIQSDTTDIKAELRATNKRVDERFDKVDARFEKLEQKFDAVKDSLSSAKIWALGLYIGLSGTLLYVLAHGFKWL
jgi:predicted nuclease with TOPRIM domain